jgi:PST family polysaccharide transporter
MAPDPDEQDLERAASLTSATVRGAKLAFGGVVVNRAVIFGVYIALARLISPADFGQFAAAAVVTGVGSLFAESGMMSALIRTREGIDEAASTAFFSLAVGGALLTLGAAALAPVVGLVFRSSHVGVLSAALAGTLFLNALQVVPDALLQRRFSFLRRVAVDPLSAAAFAAAAIATCANGAGAWGLVAGTYGSALAGVVASWSFGRFRPRRHLASIATWRELAAFARPVLGAELLYRVATQLDVVLLGRFKGAAPLGQYKNGLRIGQTPADMFVNVGAYVLLPALVHIADEPTRVSGAADRIYRLVAAVMLPASMMLLPLGESLGVLLLGSRWALAGHVISALCGLLVARVAISVASEIFKAVGRPELLIRMHAVNLVSMAVLVGATAAPFGAVGVAAAVSASQCVTAAYGVARSGALAGLRRADVPRVLAGPIVATALMVGAMLAFNTFVEPLQHAQLAAWALVVAEGAIGAAVYAAALFILDASRRHGARAWLERRSQRSFPVREAPTGSSQ